MPPRASGASTSSLLQPAANSSHCDISRCLNKEISDVLNLPICLQHIAWQTASCTELAAYVNSLLLKSNCSNPSSHTMQRVLKKSCDIDWSGALIWQMKLKNTEPAEGMALCCC